MIQFILIIMKYFVQIQQLSQMYLYVIVTNVTPF